MANHINHQRRHVTNLTPSFLKSLSLSQHFIGTYRYLLFSMSTVSKTSRVARHGKVPGLDRPVLSKASRHQPVHSKSSHHHNHSESTATSPHPLHTTPHATPTSSTMDRLMLDRESRLSEMRQKLSLWEENLTLAQVDQDRLRTELQERMSEATSIKKQWEQSRGNLRIERQQMDALTKRLQSRETAIGARERQVQSTEASLKERQQKMEKVAIEMAEKKIKQQYEIKFQNLQTKELNMIKVKSEMQESVAAAKRQLNEQRNALTKAQQDHEVVAERFVQGQKKWESERTHQLNTIQEREKRVQVQESAVSTLEKAHGKESMRLKELARSLSEKEHSTHAMNVSFVQREKNILSEKEKVENMLVQVDAERHANKEMHQENVRTIEQEREALATEQEKHSHQVEKDTTLLAERALAIETKEKATKDHEEKIQEQEQEAIKMHQEAQRAVKEAEERTLCMVAERSELDALIQQLEQRRKGLDAMDRHLQAFGEDCEAQREINESVKATLETERVALSNETAEARNKIGQENMRLTMEATRLEQERSETMGRVRGITNRTRGSTSTSTSTGTTTIPLKNRRSKGKGDRESTGGSTSTSTGTTTMPGKGENERPEDTCTIKSTERTTKQTPQGSATAAVRMQKGRRRKNSSIPRQKH